MKPVFHVNMYGPPSPPTADATICPSLPPAHAIGVITVSITIWSGLKTSNCTISSQPLASSTVTSYVPAVRFVALSPDPMLDHVYVNACSDGINDT